jgi:hypothetical protein
MQHQPVQLLQLPPVEPGQVYRRVCRTRRFVHQVVGTVIGCAGVHVVVGWLVATKFGKESFWTAGDACLVMPGDQAPRGVALVSEGKDLAAKRQMHNRRFAITFVYAHLHSLYLVPGSFCGHVPDDFLCRRRHNAAAHPGRASWSATARPRRRIPSWLPGMRITPPPWK